VEILESSVFLPNDLADTFDGEVFIKMDAQKFETLLISFIMDTFNRLD
jgi:hypothetical protein